MCACARVHELWQPRCRLNDMWLLSTSNHLHAKENGCDGGVEARAEASGGSGREVHAVVLLAHAGAVGHHHGRAGAKLHAGALGAKAVAWRMEGGIGATREELAAKVGGRESCTDGCEVSGGDACGTAESEVLY